MSVCEIDRLVWIEPADGKRIVAGPDARIYVEKINGVLWAVLRHPTLQNEEHWRIDRLVAFEKAGRA